MKKTIIATAIACMVIMVLVGCKEQSPETPPPKDKNTVIRYGGEYKNTPSPYFINCYLAQNSINKLQADYYGSAYFNEGDGGLIYYEPIGGGGPPEAPQKTESGDKIPICLHLRVDTEESDANYHYSSQLIADSIYVINDYLKDGATPDPAFAQMAEANGDTKFNDAFWDLQPFINDQVESFSVICNEKYDDQHAAGSDLNDIVLIKYYSAEPYIKSGYTDLKAGVIKSGTVIETLAQFNKRRISLLLAHFQLGVAQRPKESGTYGLNLVCKFKKAGEVIIPTGNWKLTSQH